MLRHSPLEERISQQANQQEISEPQNLEQSLPLGIVSKSSLHGNRQSKVRSKPLSSKTKLPTIVSPMAASSQNQQVRSQREFALNPQYPKRQANANRDFNEEVEPSMSKQQPETGLPTPQGSRSNISKHAEVYLRNEFEAVKTKLERTEDKKDLMKKQAIYIYIQKYLGAESFKHPSAHSKKQRIGNDDKSRVNFSLQEIAKPKRNKNPYLISAQGSMRKSNNQSKRYIHLQKQSAKIHQESMFRPQNLEMASQKQLGHLGQLQSKNYAISHQKQAQINSVVYHNEFDGDWKPYRKHNSNSSGVWNRKLNGVNQRGQNFALFNKLQIEPVNASKSAFMIEHEEQEFSVNRNTSKKQSKSHSKSHSHSPKNRKNSPQYQMQTSRMIERDKNIRNLHTNGHVIRPPAQRAQNLRKLLSKQKKPFKGKNKLKGPNVKQIIEESDHSIIDQIEHKVPELSQEEKLKQIKSELKSELRGEILSEIEEKERHTQQEQDRLREQALQEEKERETQRQKALQEELQKEAEERHISHQEQLQQLLAYEGFKSAELERVESKFENLLEDKINLYELKEIVDENSDSENKSAADSQSSEQDVKECENKSVQLSLASFHEQEAQCAFEEQQQSESTILEVENKSVECGIGLEAKDQEIQALKLKIEQQQLEHKLQRQKLEAQAESKLIENKRKLKNKYLNAYQKIDLKDQIEKVGQITNKVEYIEKEQLSEADQKSQQLAQLSKQKWQADSLKQATIVKHDNAKNKVNGQFQLKKTIKNKELQEQRMIEQKQLLERKVQALKGDLQKIQSQKCEKEKNEKEWVEAKSQQISSEIMNLQQKHLEFDQQIAKLRQQRSKLALKLQNLTKDQTQSCMTPINYQQTLDSGYHQGNDVCADKNRETMTDEVCHNYFGDQLQSQTQGQQEREGGFSFNLKNSHRYRVCENNPCKKGVQQHNSREVVFESPKDGSKLNDQSSDFYADQSEVSLNSFQRQNPHNQTQSSYPVDSAVQQNVDFQENMSSSYNNSTDENQQIHSEGNSFSSLNAKEANDFQEESDQPYPFYAQIKKNNISNRQNQTNAPPRYAYSPVRQSQHTSGSPHMREFTLGRAESVSTEQGY